MYVRINKVKFPNKMAKQAVQKHAQATLTKFGENGRLMRLTVDVSEINDCKIGDWCELWSPDLSIVQNANKNNLISYELMTKISSRVTRKYLNL